MAQQLCSRNEKIGLLTMIDTYAPVPSCNDAMDDITSSLALIKDLGGLTRGDRPLNIPELHAPAEEQKFTYLFGQAKEQGIVPFTLTASQFQKFLRVFKANIVAVNRYVPSAYSDSVILFEASQDSDTGQAMEKEEASSTSWRRAGLSKLQVYKAPGNHYSIIQEPNVSRLAELLSSALKP